MNNTLKWIGTILIALALGGGAIAVFAPLVQQATNTNSGTLTTTEIFRYNIGTQTYTDGDPINWPPLVRGNNTVIYTVTNTLSTEEITVYILNSTLPVGWTMTAVTNGTVIPAMNMRSINVTVNIPELTPAGDYTWNSSVYAEA